MFGTVTPLPFHMAHLLLPIRREKQKGIEMPFRELGKRVEKMEEGKGWMVPVGGGTDQLYMQK